MKADCALALPAPWCQVWSCIKRSFLMIRPLLFTALALSSLSVPALAQSLTNIRTPPVERLRPLATEEGLQRLALANLIATNCEIAGLLPGDAALIAGSAQEVAKLMGLSTEAYFQNYIGPALSRFGATGACQLEADRARESAAELRALGGEVLSP